MDNQYWIECFSKKGALWIHDDNPKRPHALLTSGKHSSGFFNSEFVIEDVEMLAEASGDLIQRLLSVSPSLPVHRIMGPAMGAIALAFAVADAYYHLSAVEDDITWGYFVKEGEGGEKRMTIPRANIKEGDNILLTEDVITTAGSLALAEKAVLERGANVLPYILALVNRSGLETVLDGKRIIALINHPMPMWAPEACPLCAAGSEAIRPKGTENWKRLNATY
ncbi:MAG: hypothetical protein KIH65_001000 [Candidatus Uhrbacteria bacterium]|nr:hypothetical protein [Candidatus Uhrbacteria bacterium]